MLVEEPRTTEAGIMLNMTALTEIGGRLFSLEFTPAEEVEGSEKPGPAL